MLKQTVNRKTKHTSPKSDPVIWVMLTSLN